jgi:hypothetical protein
VALRKDRSDGFGEQRLQGRPLFGGDDLQGSLRLRGEMTPTFEQDRKTYDAIDTLFANFTLKTGHLTQRPSRLRIPTHHRTRVSDILSLVINIAPF